MGSIEQVFEDVAQVRADVAALTGYVLFIVVLCTVALCVFRHHWREPWTPPGKQPPAIRTIVLLGVGVAGLLLNVIYQTHYARFAVLHIEQEHVVLTYAGWFVHRDRIPVGEVRDVSFGVPGKAGRLCYIRLHLASGEKPRSLERQLPSAECRALREQVLARLRG